MCACVCVHVCMCACVCVRLCARACINGSGKYGGGTRLVKHDLCTYTLYSMCVITSRRNWRAVAEASGASEAVVIMDSQVFLGIVM